MRIVHVIPSLDRGGAEVTLLRIATELAGRGHEQLVLVLTVPGALAKELEAAGVSVRAFGSSRRFPSLRLPLQLMGALRRFRPDVVQTWMYHADLLGSLSARPLRIPLVWNVRHSALEHDGTRKRTRAVVKICARMSRVPDRIVMVSLASLRTHVELGYDEPRSIVVHNGVNSQRFSPRPAERTRTRDALNTGTATLFGHIGRFDPQKDHGGFLRAFAIARQECPTIRAVLVGRDVVPSNPQLVQVVDELGLADSILMLGERSDVPAILNGLDALVSSSTTEGFPNVVAEAMSTEIPCIVTDVGDSRYLVGETGSVVAPRDAKALAAGLIAFVRLPEGARRDLGARARARIIEHFTIEKAVNKYEQIYQEAVQRAGGRA